MDSAANQILANKRFDFRSTAFDDDKFAVVEMEGFESISRPFRFTLTLVSSDAAIDFDVMLGNPATFSIYGPEGTMRTPYHGVLAEFEQLHRADGYVFYRAVLVPRLWRLSLYRLSEVYLQEQTIPEMIDSVLKNAKLSAVDFEFKLKANESYRRRSFVCQYEETYLDFISRWMEKEGIYYYFDHSGEAEKLILIDHKIMHAPHALPVSYRPDDSLDTGVAADSVRNLVCRQKPLPKAVVLQDYNHRKANVALAARKEVLAEGIGEVTLYGENFRDVEEGSRYASLRAEEIICGARVFSGEGTAVGLRSGYAIDLARHYRDSFNGRYLVTEVHHEGSQAGALLNGVSKPSSSSGRSNEIVYRNSFRAIPFDIQFRAERVTAKPRVAGTMNAKIDSEGSGEYADLDEFGQYKVQLPFDKTDKNPNKGSARLRMATPYSGTDHGMHFPLLKDAEVLLSFIDGDPDQPVIVGSLPNSENPNVVTQENAQVNRIATAGGNQIHIRDTQGSQAIRMGSLVGNSHISLGATGIDGESGNHSCTDGNSTSLAGKASIAVAGTFKSSVALVSDSVLAPMLGRDSVESSTYSVNNSSWTSKKSVAVYESKAIEVHSEKTVKADGEILLLGGLDPEVKEENAAIRALIVGLKLPSMLCEWGIALGSVVQEARHGDVDNDSWGTGAGGIPIKTWVSQAVGRAENIATGVRTLIKKTSDTLAQTSFTHYKSRLSLDDKNARLNFQEKREGFPTGTLEITKDGASLRYSHDKWNDADEVALELEKNNASLGVRKLHGMGLSKLEIEGEQASLHVEGPAGLQRSALTIKSSEATLDVSNEFGKVVGGIKLRESCVSLDSDGDCLFKAAGSVEMSGENLTLSGKKVLLG